MCSGSPPDVSNNSPSGRSVVAGSAQHDGEIVVRGRITGPALLLQLDTTIVVPPGWAGEVDPYGNLLLEPVAEASR